MSFTVKSDIVCSSFQGKTTNTFIKEIIGEMKNEFNKSENKISGVKTEKYEETKGNVGVIGDGKCHESSETSKDNSTENDDNLVMTKTESQIFKRPSDEVSSKESSPIKQPVNENDVEGKSAIKRSLRCRGKHSSESVLQSAIARKEKSYNESNKPQRLSRQRRSKPTLDNAEKVEKLQLNDDVQLSDDGSKKAKIVKVSQKKLRRSRSNFSDGIESDSLESVSDDSEILKNSLLNNTRYLNIFKDLLCL